jgi:transcriptional regulator with XRE-family HTH domain
MPAKKKTDTAPAKTDKTPAKKVSAKKKAAAMPVENESENVFSIGKKIKKVRAERNMTLEHVANQTGFSTDYLKELEAGKMIPPVGTLLQIARAMGIDSGFFLKEEEGKLEKRVKEYSKRTDNYAYTTLTPGAENKHLKAFRVVIDPLTDHEGVGYQHEGEEFVYVISGKVEIIVGDNVNALEKDDSLHFNSGIKHNLRNTGKKAAELIVIIFSP